MGRKILTFSFDDGVTQDRRLVGLFNKYGMKCTFNLNSGRLDEEATHTVRGIKVNHTKISRSEVRELYRGHEVAAHTLTHPNLTKVSDEDITRQVEQDRLILSELCGYEVIGMAYPGGGINYDSRVSGIVGRTTGIKYARTTVSNSDFSRQNELLEFKPTVHCFDQYAQLNALADKFLCADTDADSIFYVWGHAYEFDLFDGWALFEEFLKKMSARPGIEYLTNKEALL